MLPDLPVLDHEQQTGTSDHSRGQTIRRASIEVILEAAVVAKTKRTLRTKTTIAGQHCYGEGGRRRSGSLSLPHYYKGRLGCLERTPPGRAK
eukprot:9159201-Pyramimonas_sp.AAC.1